MGAALHAYAYDLARLRDNWRRPLTAEEIAHHTLAIEREHAGRLASIDALLGGEGRSSRDALSDILHRRPKDPASAATYAYVFELYLLEYALPNDQMQPLRVDLLQELDAAFAQFAVIPSALIMRGAPVDLPECNDPLLGYWTHEECMRAFGALRDAGVIQRASPLSPSEISFGLGGLLESAAVQIAGWIDYVEVNEDVSLGLVGLYY